MKQLTVLCLSLVLLFSGCKKNDNPVAPPAGGSNDNITTGSPVNLITQPVSAAGGTITVSKPGDTLNGLTLTVPPNAFSMTQNIAISYALISNHKFGTNFNPVSPLIHIECDGGVANHPMVLKIPVKINAGKFQMPFLYDKSTGKLSPMLIRNIGTDYVELAARYFSPTGQLSKNPNSITATYAEVMISEIDESKLVAKGIIDCGYKPGVDDWEFINYGSYLAPGGHCAGQSITSMWYYIYRQLNGGPPLYHHFDQYNDPAQPGILWQDNPKGYRFASEVQNDFNFDDWREDLGDQSKRPDITFKAFAYAMLILNEPQLTFIATTPDTAGHAMVIYKVDYNGKKLYVADPNYPGNRTSDGTVSERVIDYNGTQLGPYASGSNAKNLGTTFDRIGFYPKSAYIKWGQVANRFNEFNSGTIGNSDFPGYTLYVEKVGGDILSDNYSTNASSVIILCKSDACESFLPSTDHLQVFNVYNDTGKIVGSQTMYDGFYTIELKPGNNKLGFEILGRKNDNKTYYVDFKWINIIYNQITLTINPDPLNGVPNTQYTFNAVKNNVPLPAQYYCMWLFGDVAQPDQVNNSLTDQHTFTQPGIFSVDCLMYEKTTNKLLAHATSQANILSTFLSNLLASKDASVTLTVPIISDNSNVTIYYPIYLGNSDAHLMIGNSIKWNGLSFSASYSYKKAPIAGTDSLTYSGSVSGTFSSDGQMLLTFSAQEHRSTISGAGGWVDDTLRIANLPFYPNGNNQIIYRNTGPTVQANVTYIKLKLWTKDPSTGKFVLVTDVSEDYSGPVVNPDLYVLMN